MSMCFMDDTIVQQSVSHWSFQKLREVEKACKNKGQQLA